MNREKQIEEMAKVIENGINICAKKPCEDCVFCGADDCMCQNLVIAKELHTAGYRKSTEVARDALYLINELTEENERLKKRLKATNYMITPDERIEMIPTVESVRADTVREMQERLKVRFKGGKCNLYTVYNIQRYIDQIAEEILEGKNGNKED